MIYQLKFTTAYKKSYKLMKRRGLDLSLLDDVVDPELFTEVGFCQTNS